MRDRYSSDILNHSELDGLLNNDHTQYILHSLADAANDFLIASGADTFVKKTLAETGAILEGDIDHSNLQNLSTGAAHSYIDQSVVSGSSPTFVGTNFTGVPLATLASTVTVATPTTDTTCFVGLFESDSGSLEPHTDTEITYNANIGQLDIGGISINAPTGNLIKGTGALSFNNTAGAITLTPNTVVNIAGAITVDDDLTVDGDLIVDTSLIATDVDNGAVGFGTASPTSGFFDCDLGALFNNGIAVTNGASVVGNFTVTANTITFGNDASDATTYVNFKGSSNDSYFTYYPFSDYFTFASHVNVSSLGSGHGNALGTTVITGAQGAAGSNPSGDGGVGAVNSNISGKGGTGDNEFSVAPSGDGGVGGARTITGGEGGLGGYSYVAAGTAGVGGVGGATNISGGAGGVGGNSGYGNAVDSGDGGDGGNVNIFPGDGGLAGTPAVSSGSGGPGDAGVAGVVTIGDGGTTDFVQVSAVGDLSFEGDARFQLPNVTDAGPMTATGGTESELVYNTSNNKVYVCTVTHASTATWVALH